jgi:HK97 family phage major capsid protein
MANKATAEAHRVEAMQHALKARKIADDADAANRELTAAERTEIGDLVVKAGEAKAAWLLAKADADMRTALAGLGDMTPEDFIGADPEAVAAKMRAQGDRFGRVRKSIGTTFIESKQFKDATSHYAPNGRWREKAKFTTDPVHYKTVITGGDETSAGALVYPEHDGLLVGLNAFERPLNVRSMFTQATTATDVVDYVEVTGITNNAAIVAESTTTATPGSPTPANGVKPESAMALDVKTVNVRQFAHWIPVTTRALSDAGQIRSLIDAFLTYGLAEELEDQIVNGDGTGINFNGLLHNTGVQTEDATGFDFLKAVRRARTLVRVVGRSLATAYLMHPYDWERLDLLVDNNGRYYFGGPQQLGTPQVWGLPVVESEAVPEGTIVCGDFRKGVVWDRQDSTLSASSEHADFYIRNLVAILAEDRYAFGLIQPNAFVKCDVHLTTGYDA